MPVGGRSKESRDTEHDEHEHITFPKRDGMHEREGNSHEDQREAKGGPRRDKCALVGLKWLKRRSVHVTRDGAFQFVLSNDIKLSGERSESAAARF